jgi:hypothetical protein
MKSKKEALDDAISATEAPRELSRAADWCCSVVLPP